jgi:hypothetical protein
MRKDGLFFSGINVRHSRCQRFILLIRIFVLKSLWFLLRHRNTNIVNAALLFLGKGSENTFDFDTEIVCFLCRIITHADKE